MSKIDSRLEKKLDSYAVLNCSLEDSDERRLLNKRASKLVRRFYNGKMRKMKNSLLYYRNAKRNCEIVREGLLRFAETYNDLENEKSKKECDEHALELIRGIFCGSLRNVINLYKHYNQLKIDISNF
tara:strand:+ start:156 stop:536 length:381 start_codon:yes stop_codon:yes gene_type:complete